MARAIQLANRGLFTADPNPRVGCIIAHGDRIVAEGWHARAGGPHAEAAALAQAGDSARDAEVFVTLEPCCHFGQTPPCADSLIAAGVSRVVFATPDPNPDVNGGGKQRLLDAGIIVESGLLGADAEALNPGFNKRMRLGRPHVRSKIAASLDGRTALANGQSAWITGEPARADVQRLRARSSAILTGIATIVADDPSLNVRDDSLGDVLQPIRVIVDSSLRTPPDARTLTLPGEILIYTGSASAPARGQLEASAEVIQIPSSEGRVALDDMLVDLAKRGINEVLVEAGATLNGALLEAGLIDELIVYLAASLLGDQARGMFALPSLNEMSERRELDLVECRQIGDDLKLTYRPSD